MTGKVEIIIMVARLQCAICSHLWTVVQQGEVKDRLECPHCGYLTGDVVDLPIDEPIEPGWM